jgi:hypothetical protein
MEFVQVSMNVQRHELQRFYYELQKEYRDFCRKFNIGDESAFEMIIDGDKRIQKKRIVFDKKLEAEFGQAMREIHRLANERRGHKGDSLIAFIEEHGALGAARLILRGPDYPKWVAKIKELGLLEDLEFSVEALVIIPKWSKLFTKKEIEIAQTRLEKWKKK